MKRISWKKISKQQASNETFEGIIKVESKGGELKINSWYDQHSEIIREQEQWLHYECIYLFMAQWIVSMKDILRYCEWNEKWKILLNDQMILKSEKSRIKRENIGFL